MNVEEIRDYCLAKPHTTEEFPFDEETLVFKVKGKMFGLISLNNPENMNLKCEPDYAIELREQYDGKIIPGYHMNKKHWNTVDTDLPTSFIKELIDHSFNEVVKKLPKKDRF